MATQGVEPREATAVAALLRAHGATYEPRVVAQLLEFSYRHVSEVLAEAQPLAVHRAGSGATVALADVRLAAASLLTHTFTEPLGGEDLARLVAPLNAQPLPPVRSTPGLTVPPEAALLAPVVQLLQPRDAAMVPPPQAPQQALPGAVAAGHGAAQAWPPQPAPKRKRIAELADGADDCTD